MSVYTSPPTWTWNEEISTARGFIRVCRCGARLARDRWKAHYDNPVDRDITHWTIRCSCGGEITLWND